MTPSEEAEQRIQQLTEDRDRWQREAGEMARQAMFAVNELVKVIEVLHRHIEKLESGSTK